MTSPDRLRVRYEKKDQVGYVVLDRPHVLNAIIIASDQAVFALPEAQLGLVPRAGGAFRLARQLPLKVAMGYLLTGRRITADHAMKLGLVNEVIPFARLDQTVAEWTSDLIRSAPLAVRAIKEAVYRAVAGVPGGLAAGGRRRGRESGPRSSACSFPAARQALCFTAAPALRLAPGGGPPGEEAADAARQRYPGRVL
jgi:enoyl-CoA hydratase/carnithine racemase